MLKIKNHLFVIFFGAVLVSCKKDKEAIPLPKVSFAVQLTEQRLDSAASITWPTWVNMFFVNYAEGADKYHWDFGNGKTSDSDLPAVYYETPGDYEVALTVTKNGRSNTAKKQVRVVERQIEAVTIEKLSWSPAVYGAPEWPADKAVDVFFRVYEGKSANPAVVDGVYQDVRLVYESPVRSGVRSSDGPFTIPIQPGVIFQSPLAPSTYGYCLYAREQGREYLILSNWLGGGSDFYEDFKTQRSTCNIYFPGRQMRVNAIFK